ncbi:MAG: hydroxymethylglutaryl-CoA reductase [Vampirovibrio sp.]|jgi:hypothetical protein|nr:hydroxymethylglutaryl-CoA reductase [Vampirovibrio sp.]
MTVIPNFILKRMYRSGSLRRLELGVGFDIVNNLGPGQISKLNGISMNGTLYEPSRISLLIGDEAVAGESITEENPATFFLNQVITCVIRDADLPDGSYELTLDLVSREAGKVTLTVKDSLS